MVNSKKRDILERYRYFLETNLVLTDHFLAWFHDKKGLPEFVFTDLKTLTLPLERNKKFMDYLMDYGDEVFTKLIEGLIATGQPFLGELLESEDKKVSESSDDASQRIVIGDEILKKCPGIDKLRADTRDKLKTYLQEQLLKAHLNDTWKSNNQGKTVEVINLKRQHYENRQKLVDSIEEEKRTVRTLEGSLRDEQAARQRKEEEIKELRSELARIHSDYEQKWSSQIKMVDANNRTVFKINDKMTVLAEWFRSIDEILKINVSQIDVEYDSAEQLQSKLKRYTADVETLRTKGIGTEKLKEELYESLHTSRYLPIGDGKNKPFHELLVRLYGSNQVTELASICTNDVLQAKLGRDQANEIRLRDIKIDELDRVNRELQAEVDRLKIKSPTCILPPVSNDQSAGKSNKPVWRPVPPSVAVTPREKTKSRQTLKPISVQFGTKPAPS